MEKAVLILSVVVTVVQAASLPPEIVTCKKSDPNYKACLLKAVRDTTKFLGNGNKNLGIPSLDPIHVPKIHIPGNGGSVDLEQHFTDLNLHGLTNAEYTDAKIDTEGDNCKIHLELFAPHVEMIGKYKVSGNLLLFKLGGHGPANITIVNLKLKMDFTCKKIDNKGEAYLEITDTKIDLNPDKCVFDIKNLIDGNEVLSANVLNVMNENHVEIFKELKTDYENVLNVIFKSLAAAFFKKVPMNDVFLT